MATPPGDAGVLGEFDVILDAVDDARTTCAVRFLNFVVDEAVDATALLVKVCTHSVMLCFIPFFVVAYVVKDVVRFCTRIDVPVLFVPIVVVLVVIYPTETVRAANVTIAALNECVDAVYPSARTYVCETATSVAKTCATP